MLVWSWLIESLCYGSSPCLLFRNVVQAADEARVSEDAFLIAKVVSNTCDSDGPTDLLETDLGRPSPQLQR